MATMCFVCDSAIADEPSVIISGLTVHDRCAPEHPGSVPTCDNPKCHWRWTVHSGLCVD